MISGCLLFAHACGCSAPPYISSYGQHLTSVCSRGSGDDPRLQSETVFSLFFALLSASSQCNYKVLRLGPPEADQGQAGSSQGQWDSILCVCVIVCVCVCVEAGGGRR